MFCTGDMDNIPAGEADSQVQVTCNETLRKNSKDLLFYKEIRKTTSELLNRAMLILLSQVAAV